MLHRIVIFLSLFSCTATAQTLRINGSTTVSPIIVDAAEHFQKLGWRVLVDTKGGSSGGLAYVAEGLADIGMSSKELSEVDRKKFPDSDFHVTVIAYDAVAMVVHASLYNEGIQSLSQAELRGIYEGKIRNWKDLGGPDRRIVFFNKEPGRGTWEVFGNFLYGKADLAPKVFLPEVGANQEARTKVASHTGAITQLSASWAAGRDDIKALAIKVSHSKIVTAEIASIQGGDYPMKRPLLLLTQGKPKGAVKEFIEFILGPDGQALIQKHGYLPLSLEKAS